MYLYDLHESPYTHDGVYGPKQHSDSFMSDGTFSREFRLLGTRAFGQWTVRIFFSLARRQVIGAVAAKHPDTGVATNLVVFTLWLSEKPTVVKYPRDMSQGTVVQETSVYTHPTFRGYGIAAYAYFSLAAIGYDVVSDTSHFEDGIRLWKKISSVSKFHGYAVFILDDEYGFIEENGQPVRYDSSNIDRAKIWTSGQDYSGEHVLLTLRKI